MGFTYNSLYIKRLLLSGLNLAHYLLIIGIPITRRYKMGIFTRFKDIVNSNINALLDKAEDPEKMLKLMIQEMEDTIIELKSSCAAKMAEEIRAIKKTQEAKEYIERWQNRAELAVKHGKEDLAREALMEKRNAQEALEKLNENLATIREDVTEGKNEIATLESKLEQAKAKLKALQEKENSKKSTYDLKRRFDEMEDRINRMDAWNELSKKEASTDDKFSKLEKDLEIEKELEEIKKNNNL